MSSLPLREVQQDDRKLLERCLNSRFLNNGHLSLLPPSLLTRPLPLLPPPDGHDRKFSSDEEEAKRIAEMGKPVLGEFAKMEVIIEESYEFKVGNVPVRTGQNH